jgi:PadR family transcriptional regulator, regulatory protein PadR
VDGDDLYEISPADKKFQKELNSGTVALVLLGVLERADEPMYGYQIAKSIEARMAGRGDVPMMKQGALYPVLRSMESSGLLESRVEPSVSAPPRRYYTITPEGRETLARWIGIWNRMRSFVDGTLKGNKDV